MKQPITVCFLCITFRGTQNWNGHNHENEPVCNKMALQHQTELLNRYTSQSLYGMNLEISPVCTGVGPVYAVEF